MIHEYIAPVHFHVNEKVVLASHACAAGAYLLSHRRLILAANYQLLAAAMVLFTASMLVDIADGHGWWNLAEDGFKVLGIASWLGYHAGRARHWLVHAPGTRSQATAVTHRETNPRPRHHEDDARHAEIPRTGCARESRGLW